MAQWEESVRNTKKKRRRRKEDECESSNKILLVCSMEKCHLLKISIIKNKRRRGWMWKVELSSKSSGNQGWHGQPEEAGATGSRKANSSKAMKQEIQQAERQVTSGDVSRATSDVRWRQQSDKRQVMSMAVTVWHTSVRYTRRKPAQYTCCCKTSVLST